MTTVSINSSNFTGKHIRNSLSDVYNSLNSLASGKKYSNIGQGIAAQSIGRSIESQQSFIDASLNVAKDATGLLDSTYQTVSNIREDVLQQYQLAVTASSNTFSDLNDLQKQFADLKNQIDYNANFSINGMSLLNGKFAVGSSTNNPSTTATSKPALDVTTKIGTIKTNNINALTQYNTTGTIAANSFISPAAGSVAVVDSNAIGIGQSTGSLILNSLILPGDTVIFGGRTLRAVTTVQDPTTEFVVGDNNVTNIKNLVNLANSSTDATIRLASYRYANNLGASKNMNGVVVYHNQPGSNPAFNMQSTVLNNTSNFNSYLSNLNTQNVKAATPISGGRTLRTTGAPTFLQTLEGKIDDFFIRFRSDTTKGYNTVQMEAKINGETYSTEEIILGISGSGGVGGLGNKLAGGLTLYFRKVGSSASDVGFSIRVGIDDVVIPDRGTTVETAQAYLDSLAKAAKVALKDFSFSNTATPTIVDDFGLDSFDKISIVGDIKAGNAIDGKVEISNKIGDIRSVGLMSVINIPITQSSLANIVSTSNATRITQQNPSTITINGTKITFVSSGASVAGNTVLAGANVTATRDNLVTFLNASIDKNISKAYYVSSGTTEIIIINKEAGSVGNSFTLQSDDTSVVSFNNLSPNVKFSRLGENGLQSGSMVASSQTLTGVAPARARHSINLTTNPADGNVLIFGGTYDDAMTKNIGGTVVTFKTTVKQSSSSPADVLTVPIGTTAADTAKSLADVLNSVADINISKLIYTVSGTTLTATYKEYGTDGNNFQIFAPSVGGVGGGTIATNPVNNVNVTTGLSSTSSTSISVTKPSNASNLGALIESTAAGLQATGAILFTGTTAAGGGGGAGAGGGATSSAVIAGDTVNVNGVLFTFRDPTSSTPPNPTLTDVPIGTSINQTAINFLNALNRSTDPKLLSATYTLIDPNDPLAYKNSTGIKITNNSVGTGAFSLATNVSATTATAASPAKIFLVNSKSPPINTQANGLAGGVNAFSPGNIGAIPIRAGTDLAIPTTVNVPTTLRGNITNVTAQFNEGSNTAVPNTILTAASVGTAANVTLTTQVFNSVTVNATVSGVAYSGNIFLSGGSSISTTQPDNNYNGLGRLITKGTKVTLTPADNSNAISFTISEDVDLRGANRTESQNLTTAFGQRLQTALSSLNIMQERTMTSLDESKFASTQLSGLKKGDITVVSSNFDSRGVLGKITNVNIDSNKNVVSVVINGVTYSQTLSDAVNGLGNKYDATRKVISVSTTPTPTILTLTSSDPNDKSVLKINLRNVKTEVSISTQQQVTDLQNALSDALGTGSDITTSSSSDTNSGLQFKVGNGPDSTFTLNFRDMTTKNIYKDSTGKLVDNLDISTLDGAKAAADILDQTLKDFNSDLSLIGSSRNKFNAAINNLTSVLDALENSKSDLLDIDISEASGKMAKDLLKVNTSALAQMHENSILRDLISTLSSGM